MKSVFLNFKILAKAVLHTGSCQSGVADRDGPPTFGDVSYHVPASVNLDSMHSWP